VMESENKKEFAFAPEEKRSVELQVSQREGGKRSTSDDIPKSKKMVDRRKRKSPPPKRPRKVVWHVSKPKHRAVRSKNIG